MEKEKVKISDAFIGGGIIGTIVGAALMIDDVKDLGMFSTPEHPSPIHHWWIGLIIFLASVGVLGTGLTLKLGELVGNDEEAES